MRYSLRNINPENQEVLYAAESHGLIYAPIPAPQTNPLTQTSRLGDQQRHKRLPRVRRKDHGRTPGHHLWQHNCAPVRRGLGRRECWCIGGRIVMSFSSSPYRARWREAKKICSRPLEGLFSRPVSYVILRLMPSVRKKVTLKPMKGGIMKQENTVGYGKGPGQGEVSVDSKGRGLTFCPSREQTASCYSPCALDSP